MFADCAATNDTVGPVLAPQLTMMGFSGADNTECGGCVTKCEADATAAADEEVFGCIDGARSMCGGGISGFQPAVGAINECCLGRTDSPWCMETCRILLTNDLTPMFVSTCVSLGR